MKTNIVRIGNSKGIRLPKSILEQCHFKDAVQIEVEGDTLIVRSAHVARDNWSVCFAKMAERKDDKLLDQDTKLATTWDNSEWRW